MTKTKKIVLKVLGGLVVAYFALAVIASEGVVVDDKGKPIKGAYVVATWTGNVGFFVQGATRCYHLEATTSDEDGRFHVSTFSGSLNPLMFDRQRSIDVFVPWYTLSPESNLAELKFVAIPLTGTKSQQFENVERFYRGAGCGNERAQLRMLKARYDVLVKLAETKEEKKKSDSLLFDIEDIEFGQKTAEERATQRYKDEQRGSFK